jgi:hypothetical protein
MNVFEEKHHFMQYHSLVTEVNTARLTHGPIKIQKRCEDKKS